MGIDYYYLRATYQWPEQTYDPTFPVMWVSQFYTISDIAQVFLRFKSEHKHKIQTKEDKQKTQKITGLFSTIKISDPGNFPPGSNPHQQGDAA